MLFKVKYKKTRWARIKIRWKRLFNRKKVKNIYDSPQQEQAIKIVERLIRDPESELFISPLNTKMYITNNNTDVILTERTITIVDGKFHYDILLYDKIYQRISKKYKKRLESKRLQKEAKINKKIEDILDVIKKDINDGNN